ncbi:hypothetical protein SALBM311S_11244 [Streptomyces alboniger]
MPKAVDASEQVIDLIHANKDITQHGDGCSPR